MPRSNRRLGIGCLVSAAFLSAQPGLQAQSAPEATDAAAYAPLKLYDGSWDTVVGSGAEAKHVHLTNHCAQTGRFYVCEQVVEGKSQALIIFLPLAAQGKTQKYRTQALTVGMDKPGDWNDLEISGDRWDYASTEEENGAKVFWRTVNVFSGPDKIHFERQRSGDGRTWQTTMSGDERRIPQ